MCTVNDVDSGSWRERTQPDSLSEFKDAVGWFLTRTIMSDNHNESRNSTAKYQHSESYFCDYAGLHSHGCYMQTAYMYNHHKRAMDLSNEPLSSNNSLSLFRHLSSISFQTPF